MKTRLTNTVFPKKNGNPPSLLPVSPVSQLDVAFIPYKHETLSEPDPKSEPDPESEPGSEPEPDSKDEPEISKFLTFIMPMELPTVRKLNYLNEEKSYTKNIPELKFKTTTQE